MIVADCGAAISTSSRNFKPGGTCKAWKSFSQEVPTKVVSVVIH
jgi:hypothetical protein